MAESHLDLKRKTEILLILLRPFLHKFLDQAKFDKIPLEQLSTEDPLMT